MPHGAPGWAQPSGQVCVFPLPADRSLAQLSVPMSPFHEPVCRALHRTDWVVGGGGSIEALLESCLGKATESPHLPVLRALGQASPPGKERGECCVLSHPAESPDDATAADQESEDDLSASRTSLERQAPHRGNTMVHVCWHRNTSVSMVDFSIAVEVWHECGKHGAALTRTVSLPRWSPCSASGLVLPAGEAE
jgi:hypothetical protein